VYIYTYAIATRVKPFVQNVYSTESVTLNIVNCINAIKRFDLISVTNI